MYLEYLEEKGYTPEQVPYPLRCVHAEVLTPECPNTIARLAAGQHQRLQSDNRDVTTADILKTMARSAELWQQQKGTPYVPDAQLYVNLQSMGVVKLSGIKTAVQATKKSTEEQLVCNHLTWHFLQKPMSSEGLLRAKVPGSEFHDWRCCAVQHARIIGDSGARYKFCKSTRE